MKRTIIKNCVLYDSSAEYSYEDYKEYCEINDLTPQSEYSQSYWDYVNDMIDDDWGCLESNLTYSKVNASPCMIIGALGLWFGHPTIVPVYCNTIWEAIQKCCDNDFDFQCEVILNEGHIDVNIYHHDGTNCFEIWLLSEKGKREVERPVYKYEKDFDPKRWWFKNIYGYLF